MKNPNQQLVHEEKTCHKWDLNPIKEDKNSPLSLKLDPIDINDEFCTKKMY
jgi:hypothetical protein